jgi:hypothetical protein
MAPGAAAEYRPQRPPHHIVGPYPYALYNMVVYSHLPAFFLSLSISQVMKARQASVLQSYFWRALPGNARGRVPLKDKFLLKGFSGTRP